MIRRGMGGVVGIVRAGGDRGRGRQIQGPVRLSAGVLEVERSVIQGTSRLGGGAKDQCHLEEGDIRDHLPLGEGGIHDRQHLLRGKGGARRLLETAVLRHLADLPYPRVGDLILVNGPDQRGTLANNLAGIPTETEIRGPMALQRDETETDQERATTPANPQGPHFAVMIDHGTLMHLARV